MRLSLCARCGALTTNRPSICDGCLAGRKESKRELNSAYDRLRDPERVKFYHSTAWKKLRSAYLASVDYLCEDCVAEMRAGKRRLEQVAVATDVHHRTPVAEDWTRRLDWSNLQALCDAHHKSKRRKQ
jgi:5-methylcytosine-specific restriction protein A